MTVEMNPATSVDWEIAKRVRVAIMESRKQQREVAAATGIHPSSLSRSMQGQRPWRAEEVILIAQATGASVVDLLPHLDLNQEPFGYGTSQVTAARCWHEWQISGPHQMRCSKCGDVMQRPLAVVVDLGAWRDRRTA